jgi:hypothetical protein
MKIEILWSYWCLGYGGGLPLGGGFGGLASYGGGK